MSMSLKNNLHTGSADSAVGSRKSGDPGGAQSEEEMDTVRVQIEQAQRNYDYQTASELQFGRMSQLEAQLAAAERQRSPCSKVGRC